MKQQNTKHILQLEHQSQNDSSLSFMNKKINGCYKCENQFKEYHNIIKLNNQEIQTLQYMVGFKEQALQKRDQLIKQYLEENQKLKAQLKKNEQITQRLRKDQESMDHFKSLRLDSISNNKIATNREMFKSYKEKDNDAMYIQTYQQENNNQQTTINESKLYKQIQEDKQQLNNFIQYLDNFLSQSDNCLVALNNESLKFQHEFFNNLKKIIKEYKQNQDIIKDQRKMMKSFSSITNKLELRDCLKQIEQESSKILDCFKCKVMLFDEKNKQFSYMENDKIKFVKSDEGINHAVLINQNTIKIDDVYQDPRFDRDTDRINNTRTNSLICEPLFSYDRGSIIGNIFECILGIIQGINKHPQNKTGFQDQQKNQCFSNEDEEFIKLLGRHCSFQIQNSIEFNMITKNKRKLQKLVDYQYQMFLQVDNKQLLLKAESCLKDVINNEKVRILIKDENDKFYYLGQKNKKEYIDHEKGLISQVIQKQSMIQCKNPQIDQFYNQLSDMETEFPLITIPVRGSKDESILSIIQFVDIRYISKNNIEQVTFFDDSIIEQFIKIFMLCLDRIPN